MPLPEVLDAVTDLIEPARRAMGPALWTMLSGVAEDGRTAARERASLDAMTLRQRVLRDTSATSTACGLLGEELASPVLVAPTSAQGAFHPDGEVATVAGANAAGTLAIVSGAASRPLDDVAAVGVPWWFQLYPLADRGLTEEIVVRAAEAGAGAIVLTVDVPVPGRRPTIREPLPDLTPALHRELRRPGESDADFYGRTAGSPLRWEELEWLRDVAGVPVVVKGLLDPEDAARAADEDIDGIAVSTHGGRQFDAAPAPADVLPAIADAVGGRCTILADGSVRRGTDALKLLVRGADAVLVGRPVVWGLTCAGAEGVRTVLEMLTNELRTSMALAGVAGVDEIGPDLEWSPRGPGDDGATVT